MQNKRTTRQVQNLLLRMQCMSWRPTSSGSNQIHNPNSLSDLRPACIVPAGTQHKPIEATPRSSRSSACRRPEGIPKGLLRSHLARTQKNPSRHRRLLGALRSSVVRQRMRNIALSLTLKHTQMDTQHMAWTDLSRHPSNLGHTQNMMSSPWASTTHPDIAGKATRGCHPSPHDRQCSQHTTSNPEASTDPPSKPRTE